MEGSKNNCDKLFEYFSDVHREYLSFYDIKIIKIYLSINNILYIETKETGGEFYMKLIDFINYQFSDTKVRKFNLYKLVND